MRTILLHILCLFVSAQVCLGQQGVDTTSTFNTDQDAKRAVYNIVRYSGLTPNFQVVENDRIPTAIAFLHKKGRYISYNPDFMRRVNDKTNTDWAAVSVLAHEIGHHLLGHTLRPGAMTPGDELAADRYSGFVLQRMGATKEETIAAITMEASDSAS